MNIVAASSKQDHSGRKGKDDSFGEMRGVSDLRTAESTINHTVLRKILGQSVPKADRRGANEQQSSLGRRAGAIRMFIGRNFLLPPLEVCCLNHSDR